MDPVCGTTDNASQAKGHPERLDSGSIVETRRVIFRGLRARKSTGIARER